MMSSRESDQRRLVIEGRTRQDGIEEITPPMQSIIERLPIGESCPLDDLTGPELMAPFGHALVSWLAGTTKMQRHAQSHQPQVQGSWKGRFCFVIIEDALMVHLQRFWQTPIDKSQAQSCLIIAGIGMPFDPFVTQPARIAHQTQMRATVIEVNQGHLTHIGTESVALSIHFPYLMGQSKGFFLLGQRLMSVILFGQATFFQQATNASWPRQFLSPKGRMPSQFLAQCNRPPSGVFLPPTQQGRCYLFWKTTQCPTFWATHLRYQASPSQLTPSVSPFANRRLSPSYSTADTPGLFTRFRGFQNINSFC
jgi:hypothetical protein